MLSRLRFCYVVGARVPFDGAKPPAAPLLLEAGHGLDQTTFSLLSCRVPAETSRFATIAYRACPDLTDLTFEAAIKLNDRV